MRRGDERQGGDDGSGDPVAGSEQQDQRSLSGEQEEEPGKTMGADCVEMATEDGAR